VPDALRTHAFTLTDDEVASEQVYAGELGTALQECGVKFVEAWREADVVHSFEVNFLTGDAIRSFRYPTLLRIIRSDTPLVISTDDLYFTGDPNLTVHPELYRLNHYAQRWLFWYADAIIAITDSVAENLAPYVSKDKLHVVHHGIDDRYRVDEVNDSAPFVLHVSLAAPRKNPQAVIETARQLDAPMKIAGSGWNERIPSTPEFDNVETLGYVPEDELVDLYHRASVFYFPTLHEGFGLPVLEAMAAGCAVVTSNVYSVPEVAGDAALLLDPDDITAHADTIRDLLSDDELRHALAERAIARASEFSWDRAAAETEIVYRSVLN